MADIDTHAVRELVLFAENDGQLFRQNTEPIQKNLLRKADKGIYDHELAKKLWLNNAKLAVDRYEKEFGKGSLGRTDKAFLEAVAKERADEFADENDLPKTLNMSVIQFNKPKKFTYSAGEFRLDALGIEKGSKEHQLFRFLQNKTNRDVPVTEIINSLPGITPSKAFDVLKFLEFKGLVSKTHSNVMIKGHDGVHRKSEVPHYRLTPKARAQQIVKTASTVIDVKKGKQPFATIIGRSKKVVIGDRDKLSASIRKTPVAQPKASERAWTVAVGAPTLKDSDKRREGLTLREAKSFVKRINKENEQAIKDAASVDRVTIRTGNKGGLTL